MVLLTSVLNFAQTAPGPGVATTQPALNPPTVSVEQNAPPPPNAPSTAKTGCIEPEPTFTGLKYNGPFKKLVVRIAGKPEIRTVHHPHEGFDLRVCPLTTRQKFGIFARDTFEPVTFVLAGFNAGIAQASNDDPSWGQGAEGYGRRYGAAVADQVTGDFFGTFLYPSLLREDPRYYRKDHGSTGSRLYHAMEHTFVTHRDSGRHSFNFSEWLGAGSSSAVGNLYHPGNRRGFQPTARNAVYSVAFDMGFDILREFWPELTRDLRLPFIVHVHPETGKH